MENILLLAVEAALEVEAILVFDRPETDENEVGRRMKEAACTSTKEDG